MKATIDSAGRMVVPKAIREALHLEGGTVLELRVRDGVLEIEPEATPMVLERRGKGLVATTSKSLPTLDANDVRTVVERQRR